MAKRLTAWSRVYGTVYLIRCQRIKAHWWSRPTPTAYVGMTAQKWIERIRQHLYGGGQYNAAPKPWADLVFALGYDAHAKGRAAQYREIRKMIADGVVRPVWQKHCRYGWLKVRESWSIAWLRPAFNVAENLNNPRHIPKWRQESDRARRDAKASTWHDGATGIRVRDDGRIERYGRGWRKVG